ncbi:nucleotide exchange factor GrpE [Rhodococcus sp. NPDC058505]|uniref:nucleotide exchange factor GrpE n=1 Tax=unclassified Rhodococcus (in: high G+C Gram-positive bacteria) TaxID=192944 RepID=UPI00365AD5C2
MTSSEGTGAERDALVDDEITLDPEAGGDQQSQTPDSDTEGAAAESAAAPEGDPVAELTADLQRVTAEYANYRRRSLRDSQAAVEAAKASVVGQFLDIVDDLDRARAHGDLETGPLKALSDKLTGVLTGLGLAGFGDEGDAFDPELHEAVQHEGEGHHPVLGVVLRKGYKYGDRVLRHAMVTVTDGDAATPAE